MSGEVNWLLAAYRTQSIFFGHVRKRVRLEFAVTGKLDGKRNRERRIEISLD